MPLAGLSPNGLLCLPSVSSEGLRARQVGLGPELLTAISSPRRGENPHVCKKTHDANRVTGEVVFVLRELAFVEYLQCARHGVDTVI